MSFEIIRNDITRVKADAIVNTANPLPIVGGGTDTAVYETAGYDELLAERKKIGKIKRGEVAVTPAFDLKAKYIFHTVGPVWNDGEHGELDTLKKCYYNSLMKAVELGCKSIAFPLISTGVYGFPKDKALQIAMSTIQAFLMEHKMKVTLVVFSAEALELSGKVFDDIQSFIDENYVETHLADEYGVYDRDVMRYLKELEREGIGPNHPEYARWRRRISQSSRNSSMPSLIEPDGSYNIDIENLLQSNEKTFQEKLFELIDARGLKDSYVYNEAHLSKAFFSKLRMDRDYQPTKKTVFALAIVMKLDYEETLDLLSRASMTFSKSNKLDVIIEACIRNGLYDFGEIDLILIKNNLDTLRKYK